jgi:hypothetical protein
MIAACLPSSWIFHKLVKALRVAVSEAADMDQSGDAAYFASLNSPKTPYRHVE